MAHVVVSPDGKTLASGDLNSIIHLWDTTTWTVKQTLLGHTSHIYHLVYSPDGSILASAGEDDTIRLWDANTGEELNSISEHTADIFGLAFTPDGSVLTSGAWDASIRSWNPQTGEHLKTITGHTDVVVSVTFSGDGSILATRSWDKTIRLWDVDTGQLRHTLIGHQDDVDIVVFSPDGRTLASGSQDNTVRLWDAITGEHIKTLRGHYSYLISLAFSPDGSILASGSEDDKIRLWNVAEGRYIGGLFEHEAGVETLSFSPDGTMLASGSRDDKIIIWDLQTRDVIRTISEHEDDVWTVAFSPDGNKLASGGGDTVSLWDVHTGELLQTFRRPLNVDTTVGTPEDLDGDTPTDLPATATSIVFSPDGKVLVSGSNDATIRLWDTTTGEQLSTLDGHTYSITSVAVSPDGSTIASGSFDGTVILWAFPLPLTTNQLLTILADVNNDGVVNILDVVLVASSFGQSGDSPADVNGDGVVDLLDLYLLGNAVANIESAPTIHTYSGENLTAEQIEEWLTLAKQELTQLGNLTPQVQITYHTGIEVLEQLLQSLLPKKTQLLANYPNPFNPETWIPYTLATPADVSITIHSPNGKLIRTLHVGNRPAGLYQTPSDAAYWNGNNDQGEAVASGIYFYTLSTKEFSATRRMLVLK